MRPTDRQPSGYALLEIILATAVFSIVALALVKAVNEMGQLSLETHTENLVFQRLESILEENSKVPEIQEGQLTTKPDENGVVYDVNVERLEIENGEGFLLPNLFVIRVKASWMEGGQERTELAETYRYAPLFRN